jgi:hypothetical protein
MSTEPRSDECDMALTENFIIVATTELLCCDLSEGAVILDLRSGVYYGLDPVGTYIWKLIQEPKWVSEIMTAVLDEYDVDERSCEQDLKRLFGDMRERNLIEARNA